jgi:hypothetical protein
LRSLRGADKQGDAEAAARNDSDAEAPEPTWFRPRYDGTYDGGADSAAAGLRVSLRFLPAGKVFEATDADVLPGPENNNPCRGEYTPAGRFNVQRQFERVISYAVLEMEADGFFARRINAADRSTVELHFAFRPDDA